MNPVVRALATCLFLSAAFSGCSLDRKVLGTASGGRATWEVKPSLFCPGDSVNVSWDFSHLARSTANCRPPNGGYDALTRCNSQVDCPTSPVGACVDNYCCSQRLFDAGGRLCAQPSGCPPVTSVSITADHASLSPPVSGDSNKTGGRSVPLTETTTFTINGLISLPAAAFGETRTAAAIHTDPETQTRLVFSSTCVDGSPIWARVDMNVDPIATAHARVTRVTNTSGFTIDVLVASPDVGPVVLGPGESTTTFNGRVHGVWSVGRDRTAPPLPNVPRCTGNSTQVADNPLPPISLELSLVCAPD